MDNAWFSASGPMTARILDGKRIADELLDSVAARVKARVALGKRVPGLAVVLVGEDPASSVYVRNKRRACAHVGFRSLDFDLPATTSEAELIALIDRLNADPEVHGILVQLPLPPGLNGTAIIDRIDPHKDVDGFQAENIGRLALRQRGLRPCTSKGVMTLLAHTDRPVRGQKAVVVGVSNHVGRPLVLELLLAGCTTTACHKFTRDLESEVRGADIVVVAVGRPDWSRASGSSRARSSSTSASTASTTVAWSATSNSRRRRSARRGSRRCRAESGR